MITRIASLLAVGAAISAAPAAAVTTYHFAQSAAAVNAISGLFLGTTAPLTLDFTVTTALAANTQYNFGYGNISTGDSGQVLSFVASGGNAASTFASTDFPAVATSYGSRSTAFVLHVATNAAGAIDLYDIRIGGVRAADPTQFLLYQFQHDTPIQGVIASASANDVRTGFSTGVRYCVNFCGGSFGVVGGGGAGAVPEPAAWALLITGFGLTGAVARRRRAWRTVAA